jgi:regulation of enolase protein 1 (concanavalin A-like superfamily)
VFLPEDTALSARPAVALLVCALLLPGITMLSAPAEGGKVALQVFSNGANHTAVVFDAPGSNSTVSVTLPKSADLTRAKVDIAGEPYLENFSIGADTMSEFSAFTLSNLDINTTPGEAILNKDFSGTDELNNSTLDSRWAWYNSPQSWDLGTTRPGWLHMVSRTGTNFNDTLDNGAFVYQMLSGNFTLETKVNCTPQWDWQKAGLMVRQDAGNWVALKYQNQTGKRAEWSLKIGGNMLGDIVSGGLSASAIYLRIVREGSRWLSYYSLDNVVWSLVWDTISGTALALSDPVKAGFLIADGGSNTSWPADYDYLNFTRYVSEGYLLSGALSTPRPVTQARATWSGPTSPINANSVLSVRTSAGSPWERLMPNATTKLFYPGTSPQLMLQMTSSGIRTPDLYDLRVNFSTLLYPTGLSLGLGSGTPFWNRPGELNGTETAEFRQALAEYLAAATPDGNGNVTVPITISCGSRGSPVLRNLTIEYNVGVAPAAPALVLPGPGDFVTSQNPELWLNGTDADGDPLMYCVEVSGDGFVTKTAYNQTVSALGWSRLNNPYPSGERALLTVTVPLSQARTYAWRARAFDGAYWGPFSEQREFTVDITPPEGSVVLPDRFTGDPSVAGATLVFHDGESGVELYEYMIGTRPEAQNIFPNTTTPNSTLTVRGLALQTGTSYYFTARSKNRAGSWSAWVSSDAFQYWPASVPATGIEMSQPLPGLNVSGAMQISGTAWLRDGWTRNHTLQYRLDDEPWKFVTPKGLNQTRNWSVERDTRDLRDGTHSVQARLVVGLINSTELVSDDALVNVRNMVGPPPLEAVFSPPPGTPVTIAENSRYEFSVDTGLQTPTIQWSVDGQPRADETYAKFEFRPNFTAAGRHTVSVVVRLGNQTQEREWNVTVANVDRPPVAGILDPPAGTRWLTGDNVSFNASTTFDPDPDDTLRYLWDLGDGTQLEGLGVVHAFVVAGTYRITLTVTDGTLQSQSWVNLTVTSPTKDIRTAGPVDFPYLLLVLVIAAAAVSGGGLFYLRRRRSGEAAAKRPGSQVMYRLPAPSLVDEEEEAPRLRETSAEQWMRLEREAAQTPPSLAMSYPAYQPSASRATPRTGQSPPAGAHATFTPPPGAHATFTPPARAAPVYRQPQRPVPPPEDTSFEDIPEVEVMPDEVIPEAAAELIPEAPAEQARPAPRTGAQPAGQGRTGPQAQARPQQPRKQADSIEELMALLDKTKNS